MFNVIEFLVKCYFVYMLIRSFLSSESFKSSTFQSFKAHSQVKYQKYELNSQMSSRPSYQSNLLNYRVTSLGK